jgi:hypothetical protein
VHKVKWNGEKYQVGETVWSGLPLIEIPDLETIAADIYVPEVDLAKIRTGQRAELSIDALPGRAHTGTVAEIGTLVRPKAWDIPNKVLDVQIRIDRVDTASMRPGMSLRAKVETGSLTDVIAVPPRAIHTSDRGTYVKLRTGAGWRDQSVTTGDSDGERVVVREGLQAGDRIARDYARVQ